MSSRNVIDTPYKDIRLAIQDYIFPKKRVVTAERAKFLSAIQGAGKSDDGLRQLKTATNPKEELVKIIP